MKKLWVVAIIVLAVVGIYLAGRKQAPVPESPGGQSTVVATSGTNAGAAPRASGLPDVPANQNGTPVDISSRAASPRSDSPTNSEAQNLAPLTVVDNARVAVHDYCATFGENPVGNNAEITAALMGKNPKGINFIRADAGLNVNSNGELVDAYGTPFFFHQLSGTVMEIRSAGQDRKMWTFDDEVKR
jgi:hypothetical protein